jgi:hypothetical protein
MARSQTNSDEPLRTEHNWPDAERGPWKVGMRWQLLDGRPECVEVVISHAGGPAEPVPATLLRQLPIGDFIAADRAELAPPVEAVSGMRKSAADRLRLAVNVYQEALTDGRKPTKAVAEYFGISQGGASNLVARARAAGLLPPTSAGKAAGAVAGRALTIAGPLLIAAWEIAKQHPDLVLRVALRRWL